MKITVKLINSGSLLAKADVIGDRFTIRGFSVFQGKDGKPPFVSEPAVKAGDGWSKVVEITDQTARKNIFAEIMDEYTRMASAAGTGSDNEGSLF